ncbi:hypothetical protein [Photobacterium phosphoreum]|uniref:hypothetical protein n=1 Tax=Photobacterium phosphoreum TaxID=659 RepID=UPI001E2939C0|nr:hypothetical protein [Photobacterium phosphoreum]MCD9477114.1 hypothetical protein [Photobacterium phosphoreum]MCF2177885.1 hypothetical protein [Photobacterium phosphoreum]
MLHDIKELENELASFIKSNGKTSKIKTIEALLPLIEQAIKDSITIDMLVDFFHQKGLNITKNYLKTAIQRVRKKNKKLSLNITHKNTNAIRQEPLINNTPNKNELKISTTQKESTTDNPYDQMMEKYKLGKSNIERYIALGGKLGDIEEQSISTQRQMVFDLKYDLKVKYKGIY